MFAFLTWVIPLTTRFPREQRFVVAQALQRTTLAAHEALIRAGMSATPDATTSHLDEVATQLALTRFYIRLSHALTFIAPHQYEYATECLDEIGKLVHAWRRTNAARNAQMTHASPVPADA